MEVIIDALDRINKMDKVLFTNRLNELGRDVSEMKEGLNLVWDMVSNLENNVETSQKAMMEDFKKILGTFMSSFVAIARQNVEVGVAVDEMKDEVVGSEKFGSKQVNNDDEKQVDCRDENQVEGKEENNFELILEKKEIVVIDEFGKRGLSHSH